MLAEVGPEALDHGGREVAAQVAFEPRLLDEVRVLQRPRQQPLGVGQQRRELGALHAAAGAAALADLLGGRQVLRRPVQELELLELEHQVLVGEQARGRALDLLGDDLRLQERVVQHMRDHVVGDLEQQLVALLAGELARLLGQAEEDLQVDLVVGAVDARRVVDEVGVDAPAQRRVLDPRAARQPEVAALADDLRAQLGGVHADRVRGAVRGVGVGLRRGLDDRPDAAVPQQVDGRAQDRADDLGRRQARQSETPSASRASGDSGIDFAVRGHTPPPAEISSRE